jgi:hypothetical protein
MDNTRQFPQVVAVQGGYRVSLGKSVHVVNKQRQCSCARKDCPAIHSVAAYLRAGGQRAPDVQISLLREFSTGCPICGEPITGSLEQRRWACTANRDHYHVWWAERLRASQAEYLNWLKEHAPYRYELEMFFLDGNARQEFLNAHALSYPAEA